jgi:hypothetical protein
VIGFTTDEQHLPIVHFANGQERTIEPEEW